MIPWKGAINRSQNKGAYSKGDGRAAASFGRDGGALVALRPRLRSGDASEHHRTSQTQAQGKGEARDGGAQGPSHIPAWGRERAGCQVCVTAGDSWPEAWRSSPGFSTPLQSPL